MNMLIEVKVYVNKTGLFETEDYHYGNFKTGGIPFKEYCASRSLVRDGNPRKKIHFR